MSRYVCLSRLHQLGVEGCSATCGLERIDTPMTWIRPTGRPVGLVGPRDPSMAEFYGLPPGKLT